MVGPGKHVIGMILGNGMYNVQRSVMANGKARYTKFEGSFGAPKVIAELKVTYAGGRTEVIGTDAGWRTARGPVVFDSTYGGEDYDARKEEGGWDRVGFRDAGWAQAVGVDGPGGRLTAAVAPEVVAGLVHLPVKVTEVAPGKVVYDLGQNFAGIAGIGVRGPAGAVLKLIPGELLKADGTVSQGSSGGPMWWSYTLRGDKQKERWEPQPLFGYYGFRYVQAEWSGAGGWKDGLI